MTELAEPISVETSDELLNLAWYTRYDPTMKKPEDFFMECKDHRNKVLQAGAIQVENYQGYHKDKPALILGSGPSYVMGRSKLFKGVVFACNAAAFSEQERCDYAVAGDPVTASKMVADEHRKVPIICRTDEATCDLYVKAIEEQKNDQPTILVSSPIDATALTFDDGNTMLYAVRMTGTFAYMVAAYMGCNPIILAGIDYIPYSPQSMSRYDITKWYKVPPAFDSNLVQFRGRAIADHWRIDIEILEQAAKNYHISTGGITFRVADMGLVSGIHVVPQFMMEALWR